VFFESVPILPAIAWLCWCFVPDGKEFVKQV
jgi:hypothetical protein